jgi:hypothetical protein
MGKGKNGGNGGSPEQTAVDAKLAKVVDEGVDALRALLAALEGQGLGSKTPEDRTHSNGKLRDGEPDAMTNILDTVDKFPGLFQSLAPHDHGKDDSRVETAPSRMALAHRAKLQPLAAVAQKVLDLVSDEMLEHAEQAKDVTGPAYAIIKANADVSPELKKTAAPALTFYAEIAKRKGPKKAAPTPKG